MHPHHNLLLTYSASATRNFVHSLSHLFEIMLLILLGNDTSRITRGNSEILPIFQSSAEVPQVLLLPRLSRWSASLRRWLPDSWRAWSPPPSWQGSPSLQSKALIAINSVQCGRHPGHDRYEVAGDRSAWRTKRTRHIW